MAMCVFYWFSFILRTLKWQFQKQLLLQEARRLVLEETLDASSTAYRVGYDDASHFNREYKRLSGAPLMRDVERLRDSARETASSI
jgi:AraC-like DNA-binding protein